MNNLFRFILFSIWVILNGADRCQENFTLSDLPGGFWKHAMMTIKQGMDVYLSGCSKPSVKKSDVKFLLYTRNNSHVPISLDPDHPAEIDLSKQIKLLVPGWLCDLTNDRMPELKDAYLKRYDCNVIGVDWTAKSVDVYPSSYCNLPGVAQMVGKFLCNLGGNFGVDLAKIHLLGQSMGAQLAGTIGQAVQTQCSKPLGRITGLDPAGPIFQTAPESMRLDASDASFVDVIHTNMLMFGYYGTCGTVDFYPNCGVYQPGCFKRLFGDGIFSPITRAIGCSHLRSADYMVESIISEGYLATSCNLCPLICIDSIFGSQIRMGEDCPHNPPDKKYTLTIYV